MATWSTWLLCTALAAIVIWTPSFAQQPPQPAPEGQPERANFKGGVDLVTVGVVVQDRNGRPVTNLSRGDFEIVDSGERRDIADFRAEPAPVTVAVLFDISGSMDVAQKLPAARSAVRHLVSRFFRNSPELLVLNLLEDEELSRKELRRIRALLAGEEK